MGKIMKYEIIRNRLTLIILGSVLGGSEIIFLFGILTKSDRSTGAGIIFLTLGAGVVYFTIWLLGLMSFSKDLRSKSGYMVFLTPVSPYTIVFSKLLVGLLELFLSALLTMGLAAIDMAMLQKRFFGNVSSVKLLAQIFDTTTDNIWGYSSAALLTGTISVLTFYTIAYFASALAAMISHSNGSQRWITIAFVIGILIVYGTVVHFLPRINSGIRSVVWREFVAKIPRMIFSLMLVAGFSFGTGYLLDKKISL